MFSKAFLKDTVERAVKSAAQGVVLVLGLAEGVNLFDLDLKTAVGAGLGAALLSVLTSFATKNIGSDHESASAVAKL